MKPSRIWLIPLLIVPLLVVAACGEDAPALGDMRIGTNGNPGTLDPAKDQLGFSTTTLHDFVHSRLVARDVTLADPQADLAESWTVESGGTKYTFTLREDVEFHTGRKFDSADLTANWDRILNDVGRQGPRTWPPQRGRQLRRHGRLRVERHDQGRQPGLPPQPDPLGLRRSRQRGIQYHRVRGRRHGALHVRGLRPRRPLDHGQVRRLLRPGPA